MKIKKILLFSLLIALSFSSCNLFRKTAQKMLMKEFVSAGNSLAHIALKMFDNGTFDMNMDFLPSMDMGNKLEKFEFEGTWKQVADRYELKFKGKHPDLPALFETKLMPSRDIKLLDERTFSFPANAKGITVWGIYCPLIKP
jgi:hypothetical protein